MKNIPKAPAHWFSQNLIAWCLLPISLIFCMAGMLRRLSYRWGISRSQGSSKTVVVVGNIAVGGTGKSPLLVTLCERLQHHGIKVGIVSRGYGSGLIGPYTVSVDDAAADVGDEPLMLIQRTGCPFVIAADRSAAVELLQSTHDIDVILSDDGLQHYAMQRDIEIAVIDGNWMHGNGWCMPSGPLREPVSRLRSVDHILYNKTLNEDTSLPGFRLVIANCRNLMTNVSRSIESFRDQSVHAVAGIGSPSRFFTQLREQGLDVIEHAYPDHHPFDGSELVFDDDLPVLITEKDSVKCRNLGTDDVWVIIVDAVIDEQVEQDLLTSIRRSCDEKKAAVAAGLS